jgi:hypothetical protein
MNAYFMKITPEERENILDRHKTVYDGYVTNYIKPGVSELYVQDFANDKNGITVSNKGNVTGYKHMGINESECSECGMNEEKMCSECGMTEEMCECGKNMEEGEVCSECGFAEGLCECGMNEEIGDFPSYQEFDYVEGLDLDESQKESFKGQLNEISDMFNRFKKFN